MKPVRTRFAPSPTGYLHIGSLRTALFCYAYAKRHKGTFILRIEDTDRNRLVDDAIEQFIEAMAWVGITPDEGVIHADKQVGDKGPYIQSERLDLYKQYADQLLAEGKAYKCYCTSERLDQMRAAQRAAKQMPKYDRHCYHLPDEEKQSKEEANTPFVLRFFVPEGPAITWDDTVFGPLSFEREQVDDFIMMKEDGFPTYNFANVIDDHLMEISHIVRGQEFIPSTPKHLLVYQAFGWEIPELVHIPWILGQSKQKLSKRHADVSVDDYRNKGILPEALVNYLALLGWSPKDDTEKMSLEEIISRFDYAEVQKTGAVFDQEKLAWMNGLYIREMSAEQFTEHVLPYLIESNLLKEEAGKYATISGESLSNKDLVQRITLEQPRLKLFSEAPEKLAFLFNSDLSYDLEMMKWKKGELSDLPKVYSAVIEQLTSLEESHWTEEGIQTALKACVDSTGLGVGDVFWPTRVALSAQQQSPGPQEIAKALGKESSLQRLKNALAFVEKNLS